MTQHSSPEHQLADRLYGYVKKYNGDWATASPALGWDDMDMIIGALRRRPAQQPASSPVNADSPDGPCFYCGEPTVSYAGNPGLWPLRFCQRDGTGITRYHHTHCVTDRLNAPAQCAPDGWQLVPIEPTREMLHASSFLWEESRVTDIVEILRRNAMITEEVGCGSLIGRKVASLNMRQAAKEIERLREALELSTELLVDTWIHEMEGDPEREAAVADARALLALTSTERGGPL